MEKKPKKDKKAVKKQARPGWPHRSLLGARATLGGRATQSGTLLAAGR